MDCCELCGPREKQVHLKAMDEYHELFYAEYTAAVREYEQLAMLFRDLAWYNFETTARAWRLPWWPSDSISGLILHGATYEVVQKRGRAATKTNYPIYYMGPVGSAPTVPPEIVYREVQAAWRAIQELKQVVTAPYDWAPGGDSYEAHMRGESARAYEACRLSNRGLPGDGGRAGDADEARRPGLGLCLGDPMERASDAEAEAAAAVLLGRIRCDRRVVPEGARK